MARRPSKRRSRPVDAPAPADGKPVSGDPLLHFLQEAIARCLSRRGQRKQDRSKRRDEEILLGALRIFARDGLAGAKIGDIAGAAGIPVSTLYEYYDGKEELALHVPLARLAAFFGEYAASIDDKPGARERLRHYLWLSADFSRRHPEWARVLYLELWPSVIAGKTALRQSFDDYFRVIVLLVRQGEQQGAWAAGPSPYETAAILNGSVSQVIITSLLYHRPRNLPLAAASIIDRTMRLLDPVEPGAPTGVAHPGRVAPARKRKVRAA